jgi:pimeloyl-ACP methyl ester carboxylesterase
MSTFVLVHGAWHGSWCWKRVRRALQSGGHEVFTPTLTGVGERAHLLSPRVDLKTHVEDVANLIQYEELYDVILCGHSYAGCVVAGVIAQLPHRLHAVVYLDAFVPADGQSLHDTLPADQRELQVELAKNVGDGWRVPPIPAEVFNVNLPDRAWVDAQCTPQPLATFQQGVVRRDLPAARSTYIFAAGWDGSPFGQFRDHAAANGWHTVDMPCGHDVMLDRPEELTRALLEVAD